MSAPTFRLIRLCRYDADVDAKTQTAVSPARRVTLPDGTVIQSFHVRVITALTSGGSATVALALSSSGDALLGATAIASLDKKAGAPSARVDTSSGEHVQVTIGTADLTAGVFEVWGVVFNPPST